MLDSPRDLPQRIQSDDAQRNREAVPEAGITKTVHTSEDGRNYGTIPMPTFATRPFDYEFYKNGGITAELPLSDSKDSKYRNRKSTGSLIHHHSWRGKQDSKHRSQVMDQRSGDG